MNISLPENAKTWAVEQAALQGYRDVSDYLAELVRKDQQRAEAEFAVAEMIDDAIASGESNKTVHDIFLEVQAEKQRA